MIAPGTLLREAIDNIVRARTGALLVFADEDRIRPMISGGIDIDVALTPMILYELAKMDGAILLDEAGTHIIHANVQLMPDASIESQETGTRHRTAERVAKQLDESGHLHLGGARRGHHLRRRHPLHHGSHPGHPRARPTRPCRPWRGSGAASTR